MIPSRIPVPIHRSLLVFSGEGREKLRFTFLTRARLDPTNDGSASVFGSREVCQKQKQVTRQIRVWARAAVACMMNRGKLGSPPMRERSARPNFGSVRSAYSGSQARGWGRTRVQGWVEAEASGGLNGALVSSPNVSTRRNPTPSKRTSTVPPVLGFGGRQERANAWCIEKAHWFSCLHPTYATMPAREDTQPHML